MKSWTDAELRGAGGSLYSAGQDTTYSTETIFVMAMLLEPEVQKRAQKDIDAVTGGTRLPDFEDWRALPIVERLVYETLRLVRLSIFSGRGTDIPAGSILLFRMVSLYTTPT